MARADQISKPHQTYLATKTVKRLTSLTLDSEEAFFSNIFYCSAMGAGQESAATTTVNRVRT